MMPRECSLWGEHGTTLNYRACWQHLQVEGPVGGCGGDLTAATLASYVQQVGDPFHMAGGYLRCYNDGSGSTSGKWRHCYYRRWSTPTCTMPADWALRHQRHVQQEGKSSNSMQVDRQGEHEEHTCLNSSLMSSL